MPRLRFAFAALAVLALVTGARVAHAQDMPAPSPHARVDQRVGLTDFQLEYSSPGVKNRKIWGTLVPFDKLWRTGANMATKLTVSHDFTFGGAAVKAGSYSLFTIPGKASWTVILNSNANLAGTQGYDEKNNVASITVKPTALPAPRERMTFVFSDTTEDATNLDLEWEKLRVRVPLKVDTQKMVKAQIEQAIGDAWRPHFMAAMYTLETNGDLNQALAWVDTSIAIKPTWNNHWVKAQILGKQGKKADATAAANKALELGKGNTVFEQNIKDQVTKAMAGWK